MEFADAVVKSNSEISERYAEGKFQEYLKEAQGYLTDEVNHDEIKTYLKKVNEGSRPKLYEVLTSIGSNELAQAA